MKVRLALTVLTFAVCPALIAQVVPSPTSTPVDVLVSGRSSTLKAIKIENVGQNIPATFSGDRLSNAEGFSWYVSSHYALQTDYDENRAKHYLTLLELAYPHYVELFGKEIPDIDQRRMAVVYGSSTDALKVALKADGIAWDFGGGGITYEGINAAFNYPSGTLQYHQRYILLHECAHLFQDCLNGSVRNTPPWYYEGVADSISNHVWDESLKQLTMDVVDKATINNWYDDGLATFAREPFKASDILSGKRGDRCVNFLLVQYFSTDLHRLMRWRIWRDELFRQNLFEGQQAESDRLIEELFGKSQLDADFEKWMHDRRATFHYVDWGWEQDTDTLMSYGWPQTGTYSQTDLQIAPGETPRRDPLVMDYPTRPQSPLVGTVQRGVEEPTIGCCISFAASPGRGIAGMGLGVEGRTCAKIMVDQGKRILLDGTDLGAGQTSLDFTDQFREGTAKASQVGLTIKIERERLVVIARTDGDAPDCTVTIPLTAPQRERLLSRPMAVLSRDGRHAIKPYIDQPHGSNLVLDAELPANRWGFPMMRRLYSLERAVWRLGESAPASLISLRDMMLAVVSLDPAAQSKIQSACNLVDVVADIQKSSASPEKIAAALTELRAK